jgi:hypothetical protein
MNIVELSAPLITEVAFWTSVNNLRWVFPYARRLYPQALRILTQVLKDQSACSSIKIHLFMLPSGSGKKRKYESKWGTNACNLVLKSQFAGQSLNSDSAKCQEHQLVAFTHGLHLGARVQSLRLCGHSVHPAVSLLG